MFKVSTILLFYLLKLRLRVCSLKYLCFVNHVRTVSYVLSLLSVDSGYCLLDQLWAKVEELVDEHRGKRKMGKCYGQ